MVAVEGGQWLPWTEGSGSSGRRVVVAVDGGKW